MLFFGDTAYLFLKSYYFEDRTISGRGLGWNDFFIIGSYDVVCLVVPEKARIFGL